MSLPERGAQVGDVVLDRYRLDAVLDNTRSWAELWVGEDLLLRRPVAVRVLSPEDPRTDAVIKAARDAASIEDARCVRVLDVAAAGQTSHEHSYVVRTWVDGTTLGDLLVEAPLGAAEAADLVADVAEVVAMAHDAGLVHAMLDPQHVMLTPGGDIALLDLGIAAVLHASPGGGDSDDESRADEAIARASIADVRALGALLYACLTSRWPGPAPSVLDEASTVKGAHGGMQPLAPRRARAGVPSALDVLCRRALGEKVGQEEPFDDARSFAIALQRWLSRAGASTSDLAQRRATTGSGGPRDAAPSAGSRAARWVVGLIIAALLAGVALIGIQVLDGYLGEPDGSPPPGPVRTTSP